MRGRLSAGLERLAGGLPAAYWWLWTGVLVNRLGGLVVPFLVLYLTSRRGATFAQAGAIVSLYGVGALASGPVAGVLADRVGRRATLVAALVAGGAGMIALGFAARLAVIGAGVLAVGFVSEMYRPAMQAAVSDLVPTLELRLRAYGLFFWAANLGFAVALTLGGLLATASFRLLFLLDGGTTLAFGLIVAWKVPETRPRGGEHDRAPVLDGVVAALLDPPLMTLVALNFVVWAILLQAHGAYPMALQARGVSPATYGALMAVNGVVIVLLQPFTSRVLAGRDPARALAVASALVGAGWGLNALAASPPGWAAAVVVWTLGEITLSPTSSALVAQLAPAHVRGRYQGVYMTGMALAHACGPALGGLALGRLGPRAVWGGCATLGLAVAVAHLAAGPARRRRLAAPPVT